MATLYWGGGTGIWDGTDATHWYTDFARTTLSSRAPCALDDVVFDSASNATAYTVTISGGTTVCRSVTISGPASGNLTLAGSAAWYIYGGLTYPATGFTRSYTGTINFRGTGSYNITCNGNAPTSGAIIFQSNGGYWTLQGAMTATNTIYLRGGTLNTNNQTLSVTTFSSDASALYPCAAVLGSSTVTCSNVFIASTSLFTLYAGTSTIVMTSLGGNIGNSVSSSVTTFYNVTYTDSNSYVPTIYGNNTFNNLTFATPTGTLINRIILRGNQTVNGTLTVSGQSSASRIMFLSDVTGTTRTLTVAAVSTLTDVDFRDISVAGVSSPWSGTRLGDCGGNSNITFPAAKTVYWNGTTGGAWSGNFWATSSGGAVNIVNFPLAQDTAIIDDTGLNTGSSITNNQPYNIGTLLSTKTNAYTLSGYTLNLYGDLTLTASTTVSGFRATFAGRVTQNFTSAGNILIYFYCNGYNSSVKLLDNTTVTNWYPVSGGLDTNNKNFTVDSAITITAASTASAVTSFALTLGSSSISLPNLGSNSALAPVMTVSAGTSTVTLTSNGASFGFSNQALTWNNVVCSAALSGLNLYSTNTFNNLTLTSPTANGYNQVTFYADQTINGTLALAGGSSATKRIMLASNTLGTQRTITAASVTGLTDIDFRDIATAGSSSPWSGTRLGNAKGNSGITFDAPKTVYWNLAGTQNWTANGWATSSGGTPSVNNFPLAQDTAVIDDAGAITTLTIDSNNSVGAIDMSARTASMTFATTAATPIICNGDFKLGTGVTTSGANSISFAGRTSQAILSSGKTITQHITLNSPSGTLNLADALSSNNITISAGTFNTNGYALSTTTFSSSSTNIRAVNLGSSAITCSAITFYTSPELLTFNAGTSTITMTSTATFAGGGKTFNNVVISASGTISGSNTFNTLSNSTQPITVTWTAGTTNTFNNFNLSGTSGNLVTNLSSVPGQTYTLVKGSDWNVGANSVDQGNNTGLTFSGTSPNYLSFKDAVVSISAIIASLSNTTLSGIIDSLSNTIDKSLNIASLTSGLSSISTQSTILISTTNNLSITSNNIISNVGILLNTSTLTENIYSLIANNSTTLSASVLTGSTNSVVGGISLLIDTTNLSSSIFDLIPQISSGTITLSNVTLVSNINSVTSNNSLLINSSFLISSTSSVASEINKSLTSSSLLATLSALSPQSVLSLNGNSLNSAYSSVSSLISKSLVTFPLSLVNGTINGLLFETLSTSILTGSINTLSTTIFGLPTTQFISSVIDNLTASDSVSLSLKSIGLSSYNLTSNLAVLPTNQSINIANYNLATSTGKLLNKADVNININSVTSSIDKALPARSINLVTVNPSVIFNIGLTQKSITLSSNFIAPSFDVSLFSSVINLNYFNVTGYTSTLSIGGIKVKFDKEHAYIADFDKEFTYTVKFDDEYFYTVADTVYLSTESDNRIITESNNILILE